MPPLSTAPERDMKDTQSTEQFLGGLAFFSGLPDVNFRAFLSSGRHCRYAKGRTVFLQGDNADRLHVVMSGWVNLYRQTPQGDEAVAALFQAGDVFGEAAVFGGAGYPFSAEAAEE